MAYTVDDMNAAFASHKIYGKQAEGHEDVQTLEQIKTVFGNRAGDIVHDLFRRHTRADPYGVPPRPDHSIHEEQWFLHKDSRDMEGENMVKELAQYINQTNDARAQQGQNKILFTDPFFGPNLASIFADPSTAGKNANATQTERRDLDPFLANMDINSIQWKRPHELGDPSLKPVIYSGGIDPDDVGQGQLGNCYFLAAIQSCGVGDQDFLIKDLCIEDPEVASCGMYGVKFYLNGRWVTVLVDDLIPCTFDGQYWQPIFSKAMKHIHQITGEKEMWAMIFEKAWAKLNLSYEATDGGFTADTTNFLTGGTIKAFEVEDENWDILHNYTADASKIAFLSCSIRPNLPEANVLMSTWGLMDGHAYSVLELRRARNGQKFVHVRNPWGDGNEWKGRFSDRDKTSWTKELKTELKHDAQDDGKFWMLWEDFSYFFGTIEVCDPTAIAAVTEGHHELGEYSVRKHAHRIFLLDEDRTRVDVDDCIVDVFSSHWIRGMTAGGPESCKTFKHNPVCILTVEKSGPVEICLYQPDVRPVQTVTKAEHLTVLLYLVDMHTGKKTELCESAKRVNCYKLDHAVAGRQYQLIAAAWGPGVESAFWITAAGSGAQLNAAPETTPNKEEEDIMALETPRKTCCVVCHEEDNEGYYQTKEGYKCGRCQKGNKKAIQGKGHNRNRPPIVREPAANNNYPANNNNFQQPNAIPNLMGDGPVGSGYPDLGSYGNRGYGGEPSRLASGGGGGGYPGDGGFASVGPGGGYPSMAPETPDRYGTIQTEDPRSPQMQCYYCDAPLFDKYKNTQYGPCCSPPCWEGKPAPKMENQPRQRAAAPAAAKQEPEMTCYYCEKRLTKQSFQMTQYGPSCSPGCWQDANASSAMNSSVMDNSYMPARYNAPLNSSIMGGTSAVPYLNNSTLGSAAPYIAPATFAPIGSVSPTYTSNVYSGFPASPTTNYVMPRGAMSFGSAPFQPVAFPGQPPLGQQPMYMSTSAQPYMRPQGGSVAYVKPVIPINRPQYASVPNSPAHSRRSSYASLPGYGFPAPMMAAPGGFGMQPYRGSFY